ncbi:hypothetical protein MST22_04825 [Virgibacillus halodenitrificans]|uniref:hypothetical protein n=1 Tax=Virgibacillus halodenitrificans TaxID=1482 RepID=UPI001FB26BF7|nr:hypothetical protein [Virgibacillus halodenitrificans]MCJ0930472.1 hypothetical protein [Virgibacillus halodenitrificans]
MEYKLDNQRLRMLIIVFLVISWNIVADYYDFSYLLLLAFLLLAVVLGSFHFHFKINEDQLIYKVSFMKIRVLEKHIYPHQIERLKFIRVNWATKAAIIKVNKGLNIRLAVLEPKTAYDHLLTFAKENQVAVEKTKDYSILER